MTEHRQPLRYPRTLGEAFKDAAYASAIERPARRYPKALWFVLAFGFVFALFTARI